MACRTTRSPSKALAIHICWYRPAQVCASRRTGGWRSSFVDVTHSGILSKNREHFETASLGRAVISVRPYFHSPPPIIARGCCLASPTNRRIHHLCAPRRFLGTQSIIPSTAVSRWWVRGGGLVPQKRPHRRRGMNIANAYPTAPRSQVPQAVAVQRSGAQI